MEIKTVGILFAEKTEMTPFAERAAILYPEQTEKRGNYGISFSLGQEERALAVHAVVCGNGKVNAAGAAAFLIADDGANILLNAGLSGAVSGLRRGQVVAGRSYLECDFDLTAIGYPLAEKPGQNWRYEADAQLLQDAERAGIPAAVLGSGDCFLTDAEKKHQYRELFGVQAFDMESAAIAAVAFKASVPFLSFRQISDDADDAAQRAYREMNTHQEPALADALFCLLEQTLRQLPMQAAL